MTEDHTDETHRIIPTDASEIENIDGLVYECRDGRHLIQIHADELYEFEVVSEDVAHGLKGIGDEILSMWDSDLRDVAANPAEVERRQELAEEEGEDVNV